MAVKLNSKQMAQLGFLEPFGRQIFSMSSLIEQMAAPKADEQLSRNLLRLCSSNKVKCMGFGLGRMADVLGQMEMAARKSGSGPTKFRTLRENMIALKQAFDVAMKYASTELAHAEEEEGSEAGGH
jgi:hypothetical protein